MIHVVPRKLSSKDYQVLAKITVSANKGTPLESGKSIEEIAVNIEKLSESNETQILVAQDERGAILGWIHYYIGIPQMAFINGFFPLVEPTQRSEEVAITIIEAAKRDIIEQGFTRLEVEIELLSDAHRTMSRKFVGWYEKCDFQLAAEEVHMKTDLTLLSFPELETPDNCILRRFSEIPYERLEKAGFRIFENSMEALFLSMKYDERKVNLKYFFDVSRPFVDDASVVLEQDGEIVGFVITRMMENEAEIGPVGLVPEVRGQGFGSYLLASALKTLRSSGVINAVLDTSLNNHPSRKLYKKYGFKDVYHKQFYFWSPDISK